MVFDLAKNLDFYKGLGIGDRYAKAVEFLKNSDLKSLENGRHDIDGENVYANVMTYTTLPWEEAKYEAHENYTDIQYVVTGSEVITYAPVDSLNVSVPYNPQKDAVLFDNANPGLKVVVNEDEFMIFNPWDGHKPKALNQSACEVKKIVVKINEK